MQSKSNIKGILKVELFDSVGNLKAKRIVDNVVTTQGSRYYVDQLGNSVGSVAQLIALGTSNTAPGTGDTWLGSPFSGNGTITGDGTAGSVTITTHSGSLNVLQYIGTFTSGYATQNSIQEAILTNRNPESDGDGTPTGTSTYCISHGTFTAVNKGADDTLVVTWYHTFTGS